MISNATAWMAKVGPFNYLLRMATRQFAKRVLVRDLDLALQNGMVVHLPRNSGFSSVAWVTRGAVDDGFEELLRLFARPGSAFFDVGAHFGFYSVFLSDLHFPIVAFEPDARILPSLRRNLAGIPGATCVQAAVSDREGTISFLQDKSAPQSRVVSSDAATDAEGVTEVDVTTVDATWKSLGRPDVGSMKIDTEGHETAVIAGARELIGKCRPQILVEATGESLAPHGPWLATLDYRAVILSERHYSRRQTAAVLAPADIGAGFRQGMILLLPPDARSRPAWGQLEKGVAPLK